MDKQPVKPKSMLSEARSFAVSCDNKPAAEWILWLCLLVAKLQERLRMMRQGHAPSAPLRNAIDDSDRLFLCINTEPEFDQHENMAGAAVAVIERLREALAGRQCLIAGALKISPLSSVDRIVDAIERLRQERDDAIAKANDGVERNAMLGQLMLELRVDRDVLRKELDGRDKPREVRAQDDAVPVLYYRDVGAHSSVACFNPYRDPFLRGDTVAIGEWRYRVIDQQVLKGIGELHIEPIDGAPVVPMGEGLTIARASTGPTLVAPHTDSAAEASAFLELPSAMQRTELCSLADAIDGELAPLLPVVARAAHVIERLKDERARHEQRRLDLAERMSITPATWESIATHAEIYGLLSTPVLRSALAMQAERASGAERTPEMMLWAALHGSVEEMGRILKAPPHGCNLTARRERIRRTAATIAVRAMALAQQEGDLDTFDAVAEIEAARQDKSGM